MMKIQKYLEFALPLLLIACTVLAVIVITAACGSRKGQPPILNVPSDTPSTHVSVIPQDLWHSSLVDSSGDTGHYASLAVDSNDNPCIAYYDATDADLIYAEWDGDSWVIERPDTEGNVGQYCSLGVDGNDRPVISYFDATTWSLKFATKNELGEWQVSVVDGPFTPGYEIYTSLACDANGNPNIAYTCPNIAALWLAEWNGSGWDIERAGQDSWIFYPCLSYDTYDNPGIAYTLAGPLSFLYFAYRSDSQWNIETVDSSCFWKPSLTFTSNANPVISYMFVDLQGSEAVVTLMVATKSESEWERDEITEVVGGDPVTSLIVDNEDNEVVAYKTHNDVYSAHHENDVWKPRLVAHSACISASKALTVTLEGQPEVAYRSNNTGDLYFAEYTQASWHETELKSYIPGPYTAGASCSSLAFYPTGEPAISFHDEYQWNLQFVKWDGTEGEWQAEVVDATYSAGEYGTSLAFDGNGMPTIAYYCFDPYDGYSFRFAQGLPEGGFEIEEIANNYSIYFGGFFPSLAYAPNGEPSVAWITFDGRHVIYSCRIDDDWIHDEVYYGLEEQGEDRYPSRPSLDYTLDGNPAVAYYDKSNIWGKPTRISYAEWDPIAREWLKDKQVDIGRFNGNGPSLAFDSSGLPAITYICAYYRIAKLARWNGSDWSIETLLDDYPEFQNSVVPDAGTSLVLDDDDDPSIALAVENLNPTNHELVFLWWNPDILDWTLAFPTHNDVYDPLDVSLALDPWGYPSIAFCACTEDSELAKRSLRICQWY